MILTLAGHHLPIDQLLHNGTVLVISYHQILRLGEGVPSSPCSNKIIETWFCEKYNRKKLCSLFSAPSKNWILTRWVSALVIQLNLPPVTSFWDDVSLSTSWDASQFYEHSKYSLNSTRMSLPEGSALASTNFLGRLRSVIVDIIYKYK